MLHLDHIIVLIPYKTLLKLPSWITDNFALTPGGVHADGKTENKLICFRDGSYIELISFVNDDPQYREGHWWGEKKFGIIDFALTDSTGDADIQYSGLEKRLHSLNAQSEAKVQYAEPVAGGRKRPDGEDVKWKVTFPILRGCQRGELPFFCHDVTPRNLRVPLAEKNVSHPSGAYGIKELSIFLKDNKFPAIIKAYSSILGVENTSQASKVGRFNLNRLHRINGAPDPSFQVQVPFEEGNIHAVEIRSGLLLGNLVLACHTGTREPVQRRLDVEDDNMGGIYLYSGEI
jgi:hypothetical protein